MTPVVLHHRQLALRPRMAGLLSRMTGSTHVANSRKAHAGAPARKRRSAGIDACDVQICKCIQCEACVVILRGQLLIADNMHACVNYQSPLAVLARLPEVAKALYQLRVRTCVGVLAHIA